MEYGRPYKTSKLLKFAYKRLPQIEPRALVLERRHRNMCPIVLILEKTFSCRHLLKTWGHDAHHKDLGVINYNKLS